MFLCPGRRTYGSLRTISDKRKDIVEDLWDYYGQPRLPLILMPAYPSGGSEYGLGAVAAYARAGEFGTAWLTMKR